MLVVGTLDSIDENGKLSLKPFGVKAMALTETAHHITGRSMVLITRENKVHILKEKLTQILKIGTDFKDWDKFLINLLTYID